MVISVVDYVHIGQGFAVVKLVFYGGVGVVL